MKESLETALNNVEAVYGDIREIADKMVEDYTADITRTFNYISDHSENLSNDEIRQLIIRLSAKAFSLGDIKEKAGIKAEIAESLKKEKYAREFGRAEGSVAAKENASLLETSNEIVVQAIYDLTANTFKVKLDEIRRMVSSLTTVLMSRLSEAKLTANAGETIGEKGDLRRGDE